MAFWRDIAQTYVAPGTVIRRLLARNPAERVLLIYVMGACLMSFLVRLPRLAYIYQPTAEAPLEAYFAASMVAGLIFAPLFFYAIAAVSQLIARMFGGQWTWKGSRLALFWCLLAAQPVNVYLEIFSNYNDLQNINRISSLMAAVWFLTIWGLAMRATLGTIQKTA